MNILALSDTHTMHYYMHENDFLGIDMIIFGGDASNARVPSFNYNEYKEFLNWFIEIPVKYKILIAGNHDTSVEAKMFDLKNLQSKGIYYLEHELVEIEGIRIFGSPYTPTFGSWSFMKAPHKLDEYWKEIPDNIHILVTHGPPKGILDLTEDFNGQLKYCGDKSLLNHVYRVKPLYHIFGHIHNNDICFNKGTRQLVDLKTIFINASSVTDRKFDLGLTSKGVKFTL